MKRNVTGQRMKFSIKDFLSKSDQIHSFLQFVQCVWHAFWFAFVSETLRLSIFSRKCRKTFLQTADTPHNERLLSVGSIFGQNPGQILNLIWLN